MIDEDRELDDDAIDRAAREMLSAEPPRDLRRRVIAQIEAGPRQWWSLRLATAAALAAVVLVALVTMRERTRLAPDPVGTNRASPAVVSSPTRIETPSSAAATAPSLRGRRRGTATRQVAPREARDIVVAAAEWEPSVDVAPLAGLPDIAVSAVEPITIKSTSIAIVPLAVPSEVRIQPLFPPDGRN